MSPHTRKGLDQQHGPSAPADQGLRPAGQGLRPAARLWLRVDLGPGRRLGPGKIRLLRAIAAEGSIAAAARGLGMSYRRAWTLVEELNWLFGAPLVATHVGGRRQGGARLTAEGLWVLDRWGALERLVSAADPVLADLTALSPPAPPV